jgi:hypothetical protein
MEIEGAEDRLSRRSGAECMVSVGVACGGLMGKKRWNAAYVWLFTSESPWSSVVPDGVDVRS